VTNIVTSANLLLFDLQPHINEYSYMPQKPCDFEAFEPFFYSNNNEYYIFTVGTGTALY
jgi:hypothetical protein